MDGSFYGLLFLNPKNIFLDLVLVGFSCSPLAPTEPFRDTANQNHGSGGIWVSLANGIHQGHTETKQPWWHGATLASRSSSGAVVLSVLLWCHVRTPQTCPSPVPSQIYGIRIARNGAQEAVSTCFPDGFFCTWKSENHCPRKCSVRKFITPASTEIFRTSLFPFQEASKQEKTQAIGRLRGCEGQWEVWAPPCPLAHSPLLATLTGGFRINPSLSN